MGAVPVGVGESWVVVGGAAILGWLVYRR
jgi:hypothetical protein